MPSAPKLPEAPDYMAVKMMKHCDECSILEQRLRRANEYYVRLIFQQGRMIRALYGGVVQPGPRARGRVLFDRRLAEY